jgi:hypothetical protein
MIWLDVIGWLGSALLVWSLLQARILRLRALNLAGCFVLIGYNGVLRVWPMVGLNLALAAINVWYLSRLLKTRHDERTYSVVEVGDDDEFLTYVLAAYAADIARFNPGFRWAGGGPDCAAFLVLRSDPAAGIDVVGIVLVRRDGDVARVELDYVTPRFRDLTPGEFVYRRSRLFTSRGYRRVVTPRGMVAPYYPRLGFRPEGDSYVLDLSAEPA